MNIQETVARIISGFGGDQAPIEKTLAALKACYDEVDLEYRDNFFTQLLSRRLREALAEKHYRVVIPIIHAWAGFGSTDRLALYLQGIRGFQPPDVEIWAREIVPVFRFTVVEYAERFTNEALESIGSDCRTMVSPAAAQILGQAPYSEGIVQSVTGLLQTVEQIQHERFLRRIIKPSAVSQPREYDDRLPLLRRRVFDEDIERELRSATKETPLALAILDLDHFKNINDTHGHLVGDEVLLACARIVDQGARGKGSAYRYGGEEFALLLPNFSSDEAVALAERIRVSIESATISGSAIKVTLSCGIATALDGGDSKDLIGAADQAMYQAKRSGRNLVRVAGTNL